MCFAKIFKVGLTLPTPERVFLQIGTTSLGRIAGDSVGPGSHHVVGAKSCSWGNACLHSALILADSSYKDVVKHGSFLSISTSAIRRDELISPSISLAKMQETQACIMTYISFL